MRKAIGMVVKGKTLVLTSVVLALGATAAFAGTFPGGSGNNIIIGNLHKQDTITDGSGNDTIWGQGGGDTITVGGGDDVVDADGNCGTVPPGVYNSPPPGYSYCEHVQYPGEAASKITAGGGDDTIFGGGGANTITAGCGNDTIFGGPVGDSITAGASRGCQADDTIWLEPAIPGVKDNGSTVTTGAGDDVIHAQDHVVDTITCAKGNGTKVYADTNDVVKGCAKVITSKDPSQPPDPWPSRDAKHAKHGKKSAKHGKKSAKHGKTSAKHSNR
jgi:hypothetical protein